MWPAVLASAADLLHRHVAGERAERVDVVLGVEHLPETLRAEGRDGVLDLVRATELLDVRLGVRTDDAVEALRVEKGACLTRHALPMVGQRGVQRIGDACCAHDEISCVGC
jgi:hypothetical protein